MGYCALVSRHAHNVPRRDLRSIAMDIAVLSRHWAGQRRDDDVRDSIRLRVPEIGWPLTYYFVRWEDEAGERGATCVGFEIAGPIPRDTPYDIDDMGIGPKVWAPLYESGAKYERVAKDLLYGRIPAAEQTRTKMLDKRKPGSRRPIDEVDLALFAAEVRAYNGARGWVGELAAKRGCHTSTIWRLQERAKARGLL